MKESSVIPKAVTEYDLRLLKIFRAVVENGGFAAAENTLGITRSTISIHIASLETRMGLKLCLRGRAGFSLTQEGQEVYHGTLTLFENIDNFSIMVSSLGKDLSGELIILCADQLMGASQRKLAEVIREINTNAPDLHLVLDTENIGNIEKALLRDKAHFGLIPPYQTIDGLVYQQFTKEPIFLCCGAKHPLFNQLDSNITEAQIGESPAVHPGIDIEPKGHVQLKRLKLSAKAYQFDTRKTLLMSGRYIGFMPQSQIQDELNNGEMRLIKPDQYYYQFELDLVTKSKPKDTRKVEVVKAYFQKVFE